MLYRTANDGAISLYSIIRRLKANDCSLKQLHSVRVFEIIAEDDFT